MFLVLEELFNEIRTHKYTSCLFIFLGHTKPSIFKKRVQEIWKFVMVVDGIS